MNANELADELEDWYNGNQINDTDPVPQAATMLRQQQAQIEALKGRELTDSEIEQISHRYHYTYNPDYIGFAREVLKESKNK